MPRELKYIVSKSGSFAIFDAVETHKDMARGMYMEPVGAGFCRIEVGYKTPDEYGLGEETRTINVRCYGKSVSLGLESRPEDEKIINYKLNSHA